VVTVLIAVIGIECLRLYMGYVGNLAEKVMCIYF
jgi:Predicted membrane protein.